MAREIHVSGGTRVTVSGDDTAPSVCSMEYRVLNADGVNDDLLEDPAKYVEESPDFNQTATLLCTDTASAVKTAESI